METRGFTIIELLVVLAVLAILASVAMPLAELNATRSKEEQLRRALWEVRDAIDAYKRAVEEGRISPRPTPSGYPPDLQALVAGAAGVSDGADRARTEYFLRRIPRDPFHPDANAPAASTWALRSYASPPDRPMPGDDVFDIASTSIRIGLNGRAYRDW
jgi:general secretion pathway protein G